MRAGSISERKGAAAERVKELPTDDVDGIARGRVKEDAEREALRTMMPAPA